MKLLFPVAKEAGSSELLSKDGFGIRFVVLQAQATRMVSAIVTAASQIETEPRRTAWLQSLASEYEDFREELVGVIALYIQQKGAAQQVEGS